MLPIQRVASGVLAEAVRRQPSSRGRTEFAWRLAVGPALSRVTTVTLEQGVLHASATDPRWARELSRARDVILPRLQQLLGDDIRKIEIS